MKFTGREFQLGLLANDLDEVAASGSGRFVVVRGRRQVGKSRLIEEFVRRAQVPSVFFTATNGRDPVRELAEFAELMAVELSDPTLADAAFSTWDGALAAVARTIHMPTIVVVDEFPYLVAGAADTEGAFQKAWDRHLRKVPVLLAVVGSDLAMMEALTQYGRPLYGRPTRELHLGPLNPAEVMELTGLRAVDAFDAYLVTGGFPNLVTRWRSGQSSSQFLRAQLVSSTEPIIVTGERMVTAEFPPDAYARAVLSVIGTGAPRFGAIATRTGLAATSLDRALKQLLAKQVIIVEHPMSAKPRPSETRYRVADTYLAFWFRFIEAAIPLLERGRVAQVTDDIARQWSNYRGTAVEPVVRDSIARLVPIGGVDADAVGSFWTRDGSTEVDIVGVRGAAARRTVGFVGSIKWRQRRPFSGADAAALAEQRGRVPGADEATALIAVSSSGFDVRDVAIRLGPDELINAWR